MKLNVLALALGATALGALTANAQTAVIEERHDPPPVVIEHDHPAVIVKHEHPAVVKKKIETTGAGCDRTTVHKETDYGSKTVTKSDCD